MISLGLYRGQHDHGVGLASHGRLLSAIRAPASRADGTRDGTDDDLLTACCALAHVNPGDVDEIAWVGDDEDANVGAAPAFAPIAPTLDRWSKVRRRHVSRLRAQLHLAAAAAPADAILVVINEHDGAVAHQRNGRMECVEKIAGMDLVGRAALVLAAGTACAMRDPLMQLGSMATGFDCGDDVPLADSIVTTGPHDLTANPELVRRALADAEATSGTTLADERSQHRAVLHARETLANGFVSALVGAIARIVQSARSTTGLRTVAFGGTLVSSADYATELKRRLEDVVFAPVPEDVGTALGAAFSSDDPLAPLRHLALGPAFDEQAIKDALENCRLEYLYEPDWARLFARVSTVLSEGRNVAWFQGAMDFGPRSLGSRSVLCDPSNRWARENINVFLRRRAASTPTPLSVAPSAVGACVSGSESPFMLFKATVRPEWRSKVVAALNGGASCIVHTPEADAAPSLIGLLEAHYRAAGVPGLLNVPLESSPGHLVQTPNEAVRTSFGSAVDLLAIGRFLVTKDYWLLRRQTSP